MRDLTASVLDPDDLATWPPDVLAYVEQASQHLDEDGFPTAEATEWFAWDLPAPIRAYHCTRLLPHEDARIRELGLLAITPSSHRDRVEDALRAGAISPDEANDLRAASLLLQQDTLGERRDQVCTFAGLDVCDTHPSAVSQLLLNWGGEVTYRSDVGMAMGQLLRFGRPAIVVLSLELSKTRDWVAFPELLLAFLATYLGRESRGCDIFVRRDIRPDEVAAIWHPGEPQYDRFPRLPQQ